MLFVIDLELLDSSVIVAWLNPRDACHGRVERIELGASVVNEICLAEVSSAIRRITGKPAQASKAVALILDNVELCLVSRDDLFEASKIFSTSSGKLSYPDCVLLAQAARIRCVIATFDEELLRAAKKIVR